METFDSITQRRSIRRFNNKEISKENIDKILFAAIQAPSAKNRQPWKFIIVTKEVKSSMLKAMKSGIESAKSGKGLLPNSIQYISGAENTMKMMEQASVTIFVLNTEKHNLWNEASVENKLYDLANIQSIGAAIENMLLAATDLGIGSLWICDVFFAYEEICQWLDDENQLVAAISFGYADENPNPRPRKSLNDVVEWR